jgi:hypothetical protein
VLSIRAADTEADPGVLPSDEARRQFGSCIVKIDGARHNDMADTGSGELKERIVYALETFLAPAPDGQVRHACAGPLAVAKSG